MSAVKLTGTLLVVGCLVLCGSGCKLLPPGVWDQITNIVVNPPAVITNTPPVVTNTPPVVTNTPPVVTNTPPVVTNTPPVVTNTPSIKDPIAPETRVQLRTVMDSYAGLRVEFKGRLADTGWVADYVTRKKLYACEVGGVGADPDVRIVVHCSTPIPASYGSVWFVARRENTQVGGVNAPVTKGYEYWFRVQLAVTNEPVLNPDGSITWPTNMGPTVPEAAALW
jgi:hypothetical protein